jgi:hypothetical protein
MFKGFPSKLPYLTKLLHRLIGLGDNHIIHNWNYTNAAARTAAIGFTVLDLNKLALQASDNSLWMLTSIAPITWTAVGSGAAGGGGLVVAAVAPSSPTTGLKWFDTTSGIEYTWITDADTSQWVESSGGSGSSGSREALAADRTYYVSTTGSDTNSGLSAGSPFLTIQKAVNTIATLDIRIQTVTIQVADGTYTGDTRITAPFLGSGSIKIVGNAATPANVIIGNVECDNGAVINVESVKLVPVVSASFCLYASNNGSIYFSNVQFGAATAAHMRAAAGGIITAYGNYSIVAAAPVHYQTIISGNIFVSNKTVTLTGTPAFSTAFANADSGGAMEIYNNTFTGAATGKKYQATLNGVIQTYTAAVFPGSVAGTVATGGQYA